VGTVSVQESPDTSPIRQRAAARVRGLTVSYGQVKALDGIDLEFGTGTKVAVLGPNGAGKTTLLRVLTTLLPVYGGEAEVAGHDLRRAPVLARRMIGLMPQENNLYEELSGQENLMLQAALHGFTGTEAKARSDAALARMGLESVARRPVSTYSGGMKRRLVYARSMLHEPPVLFLDEPTTGLDAQARHVLWGDVASLASPERTVVLTTHYIEEAERLCERVVIIDRGKVVADGSPAELKRGGERDLEEVFLNLTGRELRDR